MLKSNSFHSPPPRTPQCTNNQLKRKKEKTEENSKQQCTFFNKLIHLKQRTPRTTEIITAMPTLYVCVHVWHYYMYVRVLVCVYFNESVCICMCTNTCTASASGKPAFFVKTMPLSVIKMYFFYVLFWLFFLLYLLTIILSLTQQLHSHLSPIPHTNPQLPSAHPIYLCWPPTLCFYATHIFQLCYDV